MDKTNAAASSGKSHVAALNLVLLVGGLDIHRFYLGYTWQGIVSGYLLVVSGTVYLLLIDDFTLKPLPSGMIYPGIDKKFSTHIY